MHWKSLIPSFGKNYFTKKLPDLIKIDGAGRDLTDTRQAYELDKKDKKALAESKKKENRMTRRALWNRARQRIRPLFPSSTLLF